MDRRSAVGGDDDGDGGCGCGNWGRCSCWETGQHELDGVEGNPQHVDAVDGGLVAQLLEGGSSSEKWRVAGEEGGKRGKILK